MHSIIRIYLGVGTSILIVLYTIALQIFIQATMNGLKTGTYVVAVVINTNLLGENYLQIGLLLAVLPAVLWVLVRTIWRLVKSEF